MTAGGKWTPDTDEILARLLAASEPIQVIAATLGRTEAAVRSRATRNYRRGRTGRLGDPLGTGCRRPRTGSGASA